ncbi:substrate-binding domain-containing protein [Falsiroseomonas ponticola]|uniref:ABC transporter substrate-binding protein n=1 Tax=Falsiroseomonas ponticola TaxID=2786951 RepID=UPI0019347A43|nr:ABC transporter substrate-binding protein [Roseomonas ponticola]
MSTPLRLAIADSRLTTGLKAASALPDGTPLAFEAVKPIHRAFAPMAREGRYDASEMAIVTALQALAYGKPIVLLPVTLAARFQHRCIIRLASRPDLTPAGLAGKRVGVRAYTQTTGMWVRAILAEESGLPTQAMRWATQEGAHVAEYADPDFVEHLPEGSLPELLRNGELDAAILGNDLPDDPIFAPVITAPEQAAQAWFARHGIVPVNHILVVRQDVAETRTGEVAALMAALRAAKPEALPDMLPMGEEAMQAPIAHIIRTCLAQGLLPRPVAVEEVFAPARALGLA